MNEKNIKLKNTKNNFITKLEDVRGELTEKISEISSAPELNGENIKLLKEMTVVIKELDKLIKEDKERGNSLEDEQINFLLSLKNNSLIKD